MYFIRTSTASVPPGEVYIRLSIGDMSDCRIDCRISITAARWVSCGANVSVMSVPFHCAARPGHREPESAVAVVVTSEGQIRRDMEHGDPMPCIGGA
jgi:hypothetical protein